MTGTTIGAVDVAAPEFYFPQEGFGAIYRRRVLNEFLVDLVAEAGIRSVAEVPLDSYGVAGAGSLIFGALGCETTLVSPSEERLEHAARTWRERLGKEPHLLQADPAEIPVADGTYDLTWSFDRLQAEPRKEAVLAECARTSGHALVIVPNAWNYGQPWHWLYHGVFGNPCDFVNPRRWLAVRPVRETLLEHGMESIREGLIDVPWWPGFPEIFAIVRRMLKPWSPPPEPDLSDLALDTSVVNELVKKAEGAMYIERSRAPRFLRSPFAHNLYVLARQTS